MLRYFKRLETRTLELGNHRRKYLHGIDRWGRLLVDRLEASGSFDRVHLRRRATDVAYEMDAVLQAGRSIDERLGLLGCYHALQFLLINIRSIDTLRINVNESEDRIAVYQDFLARAGDDYARLIREYIRRLLRLFLAKGPRPEYLVCAVGTRMHQDDVDLGIIDDGTPPRDELNRAIGRMATEMMRWSSAPDFYLSEHVGAAGYTVSLEEYIDRLDSKSLDFVSVTEILGAQPLVGSGHLFERFTREVCDRYYYREAGSNREHEAYLRGLLGELNTLLWWPQNPNLLHPKHDLLRPVTAILWAYRVATGTREFDTWKLFARLANERRRSRDEFRRLERAYTFVETVRHLYQQFAAQEEEIDLSLPVERDNLEQVAVTMGYTDKGVVEAWHHMLVHYHEHVRVGRDAVQSLCEEISRHVQKCTLFAPIVRRRLASRRRPDGRHENLALSLLRARENFPGIKYWQDLIEALIAPESPMLAALVDDFLELPPEERREAVRGFALWGKDTFFTAFTLFVAMGRDQRRPEVRALFHDLNRALLDVVTGDADEIRRFATVFVHNPALVNEYLSLIDDESRGRFHALLDNPVNTPEQRAWRERLRALSAIHVSASRYFKLSVNRLCTLRPEHLLHLSDLERLDKLGRGQLAAAMRAASPQAQKAALALYYDVELVRAGLATLRGGDAQETDARAALACDQYLELIFDVCKSEVDRKQGRRILTHDLVGLFVSGGHARERAFQDDWDIFALLLSDSDEVLDYANRILARVNREIVARGLMPQYHFGDLFGTYVTPLSALERLLEGRTDDVFVAMSQLVGARLVVGSSRAEATFFERVLERQIYRDAPFFLRAAAVEIRSRHAFRTATEGDQDRDIKECRGGLRDLEMLMLMWKVQDRAREPIGDRFWDLLALRHPSRQDDFLKLRGSYQFQNRLRDVYRLTVAPVDAIDESELQRPAAILEPQEPNAAAASRRVWERFHEERGLVARLVDEMLAELVP